MKFLKQINNAFKLDEQHIELEEVAEKIKNYMKSRRQDTIEFIMNLKEGHRTKTDKTILNGGAQGNFNNNGNNM